MAPARWPAATLTWRGAGACAKAESDLLQHLLDTRPTPDREALSEHIAGCQGCQETLERLEAAELAFARPATSTLPAGVAEQIVTAIVIAAPVRVEGENVASVRRKALRLLAGQPADTTESPAVAADDAGEPLSPEAIAALSAYAATPADEPDFSLDSTAESGAASGRSAPGPKDDDVGPWSDNAAAAAGAGPAWRAAGGAAAGAALDGPGAGAATSAGASLRERIEARASQSSPGAAGAGAASRWPACSPCSSWEPGRRWR